MLTASVITITIIRASFWLCFWRAAQFGRFELIWPFQTHLYQQNPDAADLGGSTLARSVRTGLAATFIVGAIADRFGENDHVRRDGRSRVVERDRKCSYDPRPSLGPRARCLGKIAAAELAVPLPSLLRIVRHVNLPPSSRTNRQCAGINHRGFVFLRNQALRMLLLSDSSDNSVLCPPARHSRASL